MWAPTFKTKSRYYRGIAIIITDILKFVTIFSSLFFVKLTAKTDGLLDEILVFCTIFVKTTKQFFFFDSLYCWLFTTYAIRLSKTISFAISHLEVFDCSVLFHQIFFDNFNINRFHFHQSRVLEEILNWTLLLRICQNLLLLFN
jgi:hypothetical protein